MADTYTIKAGDTLSAIAKQYGTDWRTLYSANKDTIGANPNMISPGQTLSLPGTEPVSATPAAPAAPAPVAPTAPTGPDVSAILASVPQATTNTYGVTPEAEPFTWNQDEDASFQRHMKQGSASIMQEMVNRGVVNSTTTTSQLASLLGQAAPEFEQAAYSRWSNEQQRAMQRAQFLAGIDQTAFTQEQALQDNAYQLSNYLGQLNDDDYGAYKSSVTATQSQRAADLKAVQDYYTAQKTALESTMARVNQLGYVDNDAALVLGVSVGTPAAQANTAITSKQRELQNLEVQIAYLAAQNQRQSQVENHAMQLRDAYKNPAVLQQVSSPVSGGRSATGSAAQTSGAVLNARAQIQAGVYGQLTPEQMNEVDKYFVTNNGRVPDATLVQNAVALAQLMTRQDTGQPTMAQSAIAAKGQPTGTRATLGGTGATGRTNIKPVQTGKPKPGNRVKAYTE